MPTELFDRKVTVGLYESKSHVSVGIPNLSVDQDFRVSFRITKTIDRSPNTAEVTIYNLSPKGRSAASKSGGYLILDAGYADTTSLIFAGDVTKVSHKKTGVNWLTTINCGDGINGLKKSKLNESFPAGTPVALALQKVAAKFKDIDFSDAVAKLATQDPLERSSALKKIIAFLKGKSMVGLVEEAFEELSKGSGKKWSVQNGSLSIYGPKETSIDLPVYLDQFKGLIGGIDEGEKGFVNCTAHLDPNYFPARAVAVFSEVFGTGSYRVEKVDHVGDTRGGQWQSQLELKAV